MVFLKRSIVWILLFILCIYLVRTYVFVKGCDSYSLTIQEKNTLISQADQGSLKAINRLVHYHLVNCKGNQNEVVPWLRKAVKFGSDIEYYNLGNYLVSFYDDNETLYREGIYWLKKSADLGNKEAKKKIILLDE